MSSKKLFNNLIETIKKIGESVSYLHTGVSLIGAMFGREPAEGAPKLAHGLYGIFGGKDERVVSTLLNEMGKEVKDIFIDFLEFLFPNETKEDFAVIVVYGNKFRTHISKMADQDPKIAKRYIGKIVSTIQRNGGGTAGFETAQRELWLLNAPIPPKNAREMVGKGIEWLGEHPEQELERLASFLQSLQSRVSGWRSRYRQEKKRSRLAVWLTELY